MTTLLTKAFERAAELPEEVQNQIATELLEEIDSELRWTRAFEDSADKLAELGKKAAKEFHSGLTQELGLDDL